MIKLIDMQKAPDKLPEVTSSEYTIGSKSLLFHPEGLFSEVIFGPKDDNRRRTQYAYIDLHCKILHPQLVKCVNRFNRKIIMALNRECQYNFDANDELVEVPEDGEINGVTSIIQNFDRIINARSEKTRIRQDIKKMLKAYHSKGMVFIDKCIVIPPFWREANADVVDERGGLRIPKINEFYQRIIKLSRQIASMPMMNPGEIIYEIHAAKMQKYVNELVDFIIARVSKKSGLVRQDILGKRIDFCGRAVIIGGSYEIKPDEIGIPFKMLVKLYEPFILHELYYGEQTDKKTLEKELLAYNDSAYSLVALRQLLNDIQKGHVLPPVLNTILVDCVKRVIVDKVVIAKRDPPLHAESVRAFKPVFVEGSSIRIAPTCCSGFNADFDGDTMAVYAPLTRQSIEEVKEKMLVPYSMDGMKKVCDDLSKDYCVGLYNLTKDNIKFKNIQPKIIKDDKELDSLHPNYPILINGKVTTVGRYMFNKYVPDKSYRIDHAINKNSINDMITRCANDYYQDHPEIYSNFVNKIIELGSKYYTLMPVTFSLDDLQVPASIMKLKDKLVNATPEQAQLIITKMERLLKDYLEENQLNFGIVGAGGGLKGGYGQLRQILICKGIISGPGGKILTITDSYGSGMTSKDHFDSGFASRNGIADRVLNTADTGYLSRRLAYALQRVECDPTILDCGTRKTISVKVTSDIAKRLAGRYVYNDNNKLELFDADKWLDKVVRLRTPIYCTTTKLCRHCYGELSVRNRTKNVGILAAQIMGERLSQSIMKTFHVGGSINVKIIDIRKVLTEMMDQNQKLLFDKQFKCTEDSKLIANMPGKIIIEKTFYKDKKDITISDDKIEASYGYFYIDAGGRKIDCTIDNKIEIPLQSKQMTEDDKQYTIDFPINDVVFLCVPTPDILSKKIKVIENVFNGKTPYKTPDHYVKKIYEIYKDLGCGADYVHFETFTSNILRDAHNPSYPARLNTKNYSPLIISLNSIPTQESWLQAFCFQDSKDAITTGLLYDRNPEPTILERLAMSDI